MDLSFDPATFSGWSPLFPLPGVVLLPGALLPLHIFEPRYRTMVRDALDGEKLIAMALLVPGREIEEVPAIAPWVGLGRIVAHQPLPDGRSNLVLAGLRRARVVDEDRTRPYRLGKLEVAADDDEEASETVLESMRRKVKSLLEQLPPALVRDPVRLGVARKIDVSLGALLDLAADALALSVVEKQSLLAEPRVRTRAGKLMELLLERLGSGKRSRYPKKFSKN